MTNLFIIDQFYSHPQAVRDFALKQDFYKPAGAIYPGRQTYHHIDTPQIRSKFEKILGSPITFDEHSDLFGQFRLTYENEEGKNKVHFDSSQWAVVIYLSYPEKTKHPGTVFYKHLRSESADPENCYLNNKQLSKKNVVNKIIVPDSKNKSAWDIIKTVYFKFNRAVIFRGDKYFHSSGPPFGGEYCSGRLTQYFFFKVKNV